MDLAPVVEQVLPHVSDVAGGALLYFLVLDAKRLMPGVAELTTGRLEASRYSYASRWILDELSTACGRVVVREYLNGYHRYQLWEPLIGASTYGTQVERGGRTWGLARTRRPTFALPSAEPARSIAVRPRACASASTSRAATSSCLPTRKPASRRAGEVPLEALARWAYRRRTCRSTR